MKTTFLKTTILLFAITFFNCEDNTNLSNDSVGNDTFSCKINGKLYIPSAGTGIGGGDIRPFAWAHDDGSSRITLNSGGDYTLFINILNPIKDENILNEELRNSLDFGSTGMVVHNERIFYNTKNNQNNGSVIFAELSDTKAIGTFECTLYNDNGDELKVTEGKFNLSLNSKKN